MKLMQLMDQINTFFAEAIAHIFSPSKDVYPQIGIQPYSGDPFSGDVELNW